MNVHDKAQELFEREQEELYKRWLQLHAFIEQDNEELAQLDEIIHEAEEAEREMEKPITS